MDIIGLHGKIGSGKSTIQRYIVQKYGYIAINFADHLKDIISTVFMLPRNMLEGDTIESRIWRENECELWNKQLCGTKLGNMCGVVSARTLMQQFSDILKIYMGADYFVKIMRMRIDNYIKSGNKIIIGDIRYQHELDMIKELGGTTWTVDAQSRVDTIYTHSSENQIIICDHIIDNNGTIESLHEKIDIMMI